MRRRTDRDDVGIQDRTGGSGDACCPPNEPRTYGSSTHTVMSRIVAIADAHLGRAHYQAVNQQGLNQREADFAASWHRAVDAALALNPDAVLVLGDLFDIPRPSYRAFREGAKGLRVHAVPHCAGEGELKEQVAAAAAARSPDHMNLLVTHAAVTVLSRRYTYGDVNELEVDLATLDAGFDRILLGHFHNFAKVAPNAWYPGSTDTFSFADLPPSEEPEVKGLLSLETTSGRVRHHPVPGARPLRTYRVDAFALDLGEVYDAVAGLVAPGETDGAVVRLWVDQARPELRRLLDRREVAEAFPGALVVNVQVEAVDEEGAAQLAGQPVASLADEWDRYLASVPIEGYDRDRLAALGRAHLQRAEEEAG